MTVELLVVTAGGLLAAFINAAFATGGIYLTLASSSFVFPLSVAIPLQSAFAFASLAARIAYFRQYIYWPIVGLFVIGSVFGVAIGSTVFVALPEATIALLLGLFLLVLIWMPSVRQDTGLHNTGLHHAGTHIAGTPGASSKSSALNNVQSAGTAKQSAEAQRSSAQGASSQSTTARGVVTESDITKSEATERVAKRNQQPLTWIFLPVGVAHSFLGTVFGVGTLLQPTILRTTLTKLQITGTLAACLLCMDVFKLTGYIAHGFDYRDYWPHIVCATIAGFIGTVAGKRVTRRVSEQTFRLVFKGLITLVALRLVYRAIVLW